MWNAVRSKLLAPFAWVRSLYKVSAGILRRHPIITLMVAFPACVAVTLLTGLWWLGSGIFLLGLLLFSSVSLWGGTLKVTTFALQAASCSLMMFMAAALLLPVSYLWVSYLVAPATLILLELIHNGVALKVFETEARVLMEPTCQ